METHLALKMFIKFHLEKHTEEAKSSALRVLASPKSPVYKQNLVSFPKAIAKWQ